MLEVFSSGLGRAARVLTGGRRGSKSSQCGLYSSSSSGRAAGVVCTRAHFVEGPQRAASAAYTRAHLREEQPVWFILEVGGAQRAASAAYTRAHLREEQPVWFILERGSGVLKEQPVRFVPKLILSGVLKEQPVRLLFELIVSESSQCGLYSSSSSGRAAGVVCTRPRRVEGPQRAVSAYTRAHLRDEQPVRLLLEFISSGVLKEQPVWFMKVQCFYSSSSSGRAACTRAHLGCSKSSQCGLCWSSSSRAGAAYTGSLRRAQRAAGAACNRGFGAMA